MSDRPHPGELLALTGAKTISNTALRWVGPFLPTLERAFGASTGTLTSVIGIAELGGLTTAVSGRTIDRGHERTVFVAGMSAVLASSLIALIGEVWSFAVSFVVLVLGVANLTVAGHTWIGHRVALGRRARALGIFEMSWAIALLVGAPILAAVIAVAGWRGAYVALAIAAAVGIAWALVFVRPDVPRPAPATGPTGRIPHTAWAPMIASALTAAAGIGMFVVSGAWLDDEFGVSTGGLGAIAAAIGLIELTSSGAVVGLGDRIGARRAVAFGLAVLGVGGLLMTSASSRGAAIVALLVYIAGFEFAFVSSLALVTEAAPLARGRAIGLSNAIGTIARAGAVTVSGRLYEAFGIGGTIALTLGAAAVAAVALGLTRPASEP